MRINNINFALTSAYRIKQNRLNFKGVTMGEYNPIASGTNENGDILNLSDKFKIELSKIRQASADKRRNVEGFLKNRKLKAIDHDEDKEISGFLKAQSVAIDEQNELIKVLKENLLLLEQNNATKEELIAAKKALLMAQNAADISKHLSVKKSQNYGFDAIAGYEKEKFILTDQFTNLLPYEQAGADINLAGCILFYGPVGNGKTSFAKAFAQSAGCDYDEAKFVSQSRGANSKERRKEYEKGLFADLLNKAIIAQEKFKNAGIRTIILLDEIDRIAYEGSSIEGDLKRFLEKCSSEYHCTVFATTNNPFVISNPLITEKRIPIKVSIDPPNFENAKAIFYHYLKNCPGIDLDAIDFDELAKEICAPNPTRAYNASQIEKIVEDCAKNYQKPTQVDIIYEIRKKEPGLSFEALEKYKEEKEFFGDDVDVE